MLLSTLKTTEGALPRVPCLIGQWVTVAILSKEDNETEGSATETGGLPGESQKGT